MGQTNDRHSKKSPRTATRYNDVKFVQYELNKDEKLSCKTWSESLEDFSTVILRFCEQGYSISVKWDNYSSSFAAFGSSKESANPNYGLMLTGRGSTPLKAMKQLLFKHFIIFDESWAAYAETREQYELDD